MKIEWKNCITTSSVHINEFSLTSSQTFACSSEKSSNKLDKVIVSVLIDESVSLLSSIWLLRSFKANATARTATPNPPTVIRSYK